MKREITQYTISWEPARDPDPQGFSSATEVAHYCVENSGLQHKEVAYRVGMSTSLLTMKLHGNTANLSADEYDRLADALGDKGFLMRKYHAVKLLPRQDQRDVLLSRLSEQQQVMTKLLADLKSGRK